MLLKTPACVKTLSKVIYRILVLTGKGSFSKQLFHAHIHGNGNSKNNGFVVRLCKLLTLINQYSSSLALVFRLSLPSSLPGYVLYQYGCIN